MSFTHFSKGDEVEVTRETSAGGYYDRTNATWHPAIVRRSPASKNKNQIYVQYKNLTSDSSNKPLKEYVDVTNVRPVPPPELHRCFIVGDVVDALLNEEVWRKGTVTDILENSCYCVKFDGNGENIEVEQCNLRLHREWDDGSWVPPLQEQLELRLKSPEMVVKPRPLILRFKLRKKETEAKFSQGAMVEVSSDEEGYQGSWYAAKIIGAVGNDKFLVEYLDLKSDDLAKPHTEEAYVHNIRPYPPEIPRPNCFKLLEEVDARYNDGWWAGVISSALDGLKYVVYFSFTKDHLEFEHSKLRPHQDWINGKWVIASKEKSNESVVFEGVKLITNGSEKKSEKEFAKGTKVEVKSDVEGFIGSWFTAKIVDLIENDKFLVEYLTLRTDDETEPLQEEAHASFIRPCPPDIQRLDRFREFEKVDAWYNDGWWVGSVSKVLCNLKYAVYFATSKEELKLDHSALRPHQEWIDGKWFLQD